jgi:hypothetical protein
MEEIYFIKIAGKANIPEKLAIGHNYKLVADCSITSELRQDNENGSFDVIYKVEPVTIEVTKDNGKVIKAKDPRSNSVKFRNSCWKVANNHGLDTEAFYNYATIQSILLLDQFAEQFKKR